MRSIDTATELQPRSVKIAVLRGGTRYWQQEARSRITSLAGIPSLGATVADHDRAGIQRDVTAALQHASGLTERNRGSDWLHGGRVEETWRLIRAAEEGILNVATGWDLVERVKDAAIYGEQRLGTDHPLVQQLTQMMSTATARVTS